MKIFTFRYESNPRKKAMERMKKVIATGVPDIRNDELVCDSFETMLKLISKSRFEVFAAIVEHKPASLYELAGYLKKDQANVLKDARALESLGLIRLKPIKEGGREKLTPQALYDKIVFEFEPKRASKAG
jgi:predicted transcriptional regulator